MGTSLKEFKSFYHVVDFWQEENLPSQIDLVFKPKLKIYIRTIASRRKIPKTTFQEEVIHPDSIYRNHIASIFDAAEMMGI